MSSNVGLSTPRGSGTSGYVQRNLSNLKPRDHSYGQPYPDPKDLLKHRQRQPDKQILEHDRRREIEVKVFDLRDKLEDEGVNEDEIEERCEKERERLGKEYEKSGGKGSGGSGKAAARGLKSHQVHELAEAKIEESERLRRALGIRADYEEGGHWKEKEERLKSSLKEEKRDEQSERK